jgi:pSer/pThr/pTyr-binding forkhead associated (FHA) protein
VSASPHGGVVIATALDSEEALLALKIGFLVLLYVFIWMVVRSATRDLRASPQESIVLSAAEADALRAEHVAPSPSARLLVLASSDLAAGSVQEITGPVRIGRGPENGLRLDIDEYASSRHALVEPRADGLWLQDVGSTNGTFVNGARIGDPRLLRPGDVIRVGQSDFRVEP